MGQQHVRASMLYWQKKRENDVKIEVADNKYGGIRAY